ncbi:acyl-CoA dehydrogenase family protein [Nocardioides speluncae]|uniref:acyl-CoA dehydrogenase family protein n=1 Tax=Nocardioides speluncae TaxID=2670337 RepID=UPI000D6896BF|nr:acyl-CoA dehydrogenase family protein [Nocardioides speluncae]
MDFEESPEHRALRAAVAELGAKYGHDYASAKAKAKEPMSELWDEAGSLGYLGVNLPEEYGGGGAGMYELSLVLEELSAVGCGLLMMVVSPAIAGTILTRFGTERQQQAWLPGLADGTKKIAFGITEPDAGSNSHELTTTARRDGDDYVLNGRKTFISGVSEADAVLVVGRLESAKTGKLQPALFLVPTDTPGFEYQPIEMDLVMPEHQYQVFLDDVRVPAAALVGESEEETALWQLFAGLNPERIMGAAMALGNARYALDKAVAYAKERKVWGAPIGAHQGLSHPLAQIKVEYECARLMYLKAATIYDSGDDEAAGEGANMAKYACAEVAAKAADQAVQTHGGNGLASEYGLGNLLAITRVARIAPVSREMVLNYVAQNSLGLPKSY